MSILGYDEVWLKEKGAIHTAAEIAGQPELWLKPYSLIAARKEGIEIFLKQAVAEASRIILTGAGTSAYIGLSLHSVLVNIFTVIYAIPYYRPVSHPADYFFQQERFCDFFCSFGKQSGKFAAVAHRLIKLCEGFPSHNYLRPEGQLSSSHCFTQVNLVRGGGRGPSPMTGSGYDRQF
jgi:hypothetical protein